MAKKRCSFAFDAPVSIVLVLAYLAVYALNITLSRRAPLPDGQTIVSYLFTCSTIDLKAPLDYLRLFSHVLGATGWEPLLLNALLLLLLGRSAETACGSAVPVITLPLAALVSGVLTCLVSDLSAQGPDPLIFMFLLLNFFICLSEGSVSFSWILAFLIFTAIRAYGIIEPLVPADPRTILTACLPIFIPLAGGIVGSLPALFLLGGGKDRSRPKAPAREKTKPSKKRSRSEVTVSADMDDTFSETLDI